MKRLLCLLFVLSLSTTEVKSCFEETFDSDRLLTTTYPLSIEGTCQDSYFQIEIIPNLELDGSEEEFYTLEIKEQNEDIMLFELDSEITSEETKTVYLSSYSNLLSMNATMNLANDTDGEFPFSVHFKEIPFKRYPTESITANLTVVSNTVTKTLEANEQITYKLSVASPGDQYYDVTYKPQSSPSGFLAMRNGNGRIILMTSPMSQHSQKLTLGTNNEVTIDVVTQNSPSDAANTTYSIRYSIGHNDLTTTTPKPSTTTTPRGLASARIYVLEVNVQSFVETSIAKLQAEIAAIGSKAACNMTLSPSVDCRRSCAMSDDLDRGCVTFAVDVAKSYFCNLTSDDMLASVLESKIPSWKENYDLDRIELNDCLTSAQASWISVAVAVPLVAMAVIIAGLMIMKTFHDKQKKRRSSYSRMRSEQRKSGMSSFAQGRNSKGGTMNRNMQFEFVDD